LDINSLANKRLPKNRELAPDWHRTRRDVLAPNKLADKSLHLVGRIALHIRQCVRIALHSD
jgi:hypothetical protein